MTTQIWENQLCPNTGKIMVRDVRPFTLSYQNNSITFDMPGWYCNECNESIHSGVDMEISDNVLNKLKTIKE